MSNVILDKDGAAYIRIPRRDDRLMVEKVVYAESRAHRMIYHMAEGRGEYTVYGKLCDMEKELQPFGFCRTHQSFLVNMAYVCDVRRYEATMLDGDSIPISKRHYKKVQDWHRQRKKQG